MLVEQMRPVPTRDSRVTDIALNTLDVQKRVPHRARLKLHAGGAGEANGFEAPERGGKIITSGGDRFGKEESMAMQAPCASDCNGACALVPMPHRRARR